MKKCKDLLNVLPHPCAAVCTLAILFSADGLFTAFDFEQADPFFVHVVYLVSSYDIIVSCVLIGGVPCRQGLPAGHAQ